jgi:type I restriction enzyme S subunit
MISDITDRMFLSKMNDMPFRPIGKIATIKAGGDCPKKYSSFPSSECNIPIYSNGTSNDGLYGYTDKAQVTKRSITIAARGTIGFCVRRYVNYVPIIRLISVIPYDLGADTFLHQIISRLSFKKNGSVQQQLTVPELSTLNIPYPSKQALKEYEIKTHPLILSINHNNTENFLLTKQRDELLPLLMNGQATVNYHLSAC